MCTIYKIMHHNVASSPLDHFAARVTLGPLVVVSVQLMAAVTSEEVQNAMGMYPAPSFICACISIFICFHIICFYLILYDIYIIFICFRII